jgi:hypothetical protein
MPMFDKSVLDKVRATLDASSTTFFAYEEGYEPNTKGDIVIAGSFNDPEKGKADLNCKISFQITEEIK